MTLIYNRNRMATIYSITSDKGNKVYIGSTKISLARRKATHRHDSKREVYCSSRIIIDEYGWENCIFTVLEECLLEQRYERERWYIENTEHTVNKGIPGTTIKERNISYRQKNKEEIREQQKRYRESNRERINKQKLEAYYAKKKLAQT